MSVQCAECLRCCLCVGGGRDTKSIGRRGTISDLKDISMKSRALLVEIYGSNYSSWRQYLECSTLTVTYKVTEVLTELRQ